LHKKKKKKKKKKKNKNKKKINYLLYNKINFTLSPSIYIYIYISYFLYMKTFNNQDMVNVLRFHPKDQDLFIAGLYKKGIVCWDVRSNK